MKKTLIIVGIIAMNLYAVAQNLNSGLIGYYPLDGNAVEANDNGIDGTLMNGVVPAEDRNGNSNGALYFDGLSSYVTFGDVYDMNLDDRSYSIWVKIDRQLSTGQAILAKYIGFQPYRYSLLTVEGLVYNYVGWNGSSAKSVLTSSTLNTDGWYLLTTTIDRDGDLISYVNGQEAARMSIAAYSSENFESTYHFALGHNHGDQYLQGSLDDLRIYNRVLTAEEVELLYTSTPEEPEDTTQIVGAFWSGNEAAISFSGRVGIGTDQPQSLLSLGSNSFTTHTGVSEADALLRFDNTYIDSEAKPNKILLYQTETASYGIGLSSSDFDFLSFHNFRFYTQHTPTSEGYNALSILSSGQVAIGTPTVPAGYKMAVDGNIITEMITVKMSEQWPDYVFAKDYSLMSLEDIEKFINKQGHLPQVPSAKEIEKDGVNLGAMDAILLQKIEEMTLYMIELEKANKELKKLNADFERRLSELEKK